MFRLLTLNLNFDVSKHGDWPERRRRLTHILQTHQPDVVALQATVKPAEDIPDQIGQMAQVLPAYRFTSFQMSHNRGNGREEGMGWLSRVALSDIHVQPLLPGPPPVEDSYIRAILHARVDRSFGPLHLLNAHISWVTTQASAQLEAAQRFANRFPHPRIWVGDFNQTPDSPLLASVTQQGWVDAWKHLRGNEVGFTFETGSPTLRIDYVWMDSDLVPRLRSIRLLGNTGEGDLSDHLGLLVELDD